MHENGVEMITRLRWRREARSIDGQRDHQRQGGSHHTKTHESGGGRMDMFKYIWLMGVGVGTQSTRRYRIYVYI